MIIRVIARYDCIRALTFQESLTFHNYNVRIWEILDV